jgi:acyl carrier protein
VNIQTRAIVEHRRDLTERIKSVLIERLDLNLQPNEMTEDAPLFGMGLGLDSIDALVLIVGIEDEFDVTVETTDHHVYRSINTLVDYLMATADKAAASPTVVDA